MRLLLIFLKEPVQGQVKARLAADVGEDDATRYYKALVEILLRQLQGLNQTRIRFCYAPDDADDAIRFWILPLMKATRGTTEDVFLAPSTPTTTEKTQEIDFHAQGDGDLGARLNRAFERGFADGFQEIAVIGTDCPECGSRWINGAFARLSASLDRHGVVGPCPDRGYYLLALKSHTPEMFIDIPWSSCDILQATLAAAKSSQLMIDQLPPLSDVHHLDDWYRVMASPLGAALKKALGDTKDIKDT